MSGYSAEFGQKKRAGSAFQPLFHLSPKARRHLDSPKKPTQTKFALALIGRTNAVRTRKTGEDPASAGRVRKALSSP
jgi:hypothetical protein